MANYRKVKARRNSTRCGMCKYYKKVGNAKYHWSHKDQMKRYENDVEISN